MIVKYVIKHKESGKYINDNGKFTTDVEKAMLYPSRASAREAKQDDEVVCKVEVNITEVAI